MDGSTRGVVVVGARFTAAGEARAALGALAAFNVTRGAEQSTTPVRLPVWPGFRHLSEPQPEWLLLDVLGMQLVPDAYADAASSPEATGEETSKHLRRARVRV